MKRMRSQFWKQALGVIGGTALVITTVVSCSPNAPAESTDANVPTPQQEPIAQAPSPQEWRRMTETEVDQQWNYILNSPLGVAALNQLAIEGFISPLCSRTFYVNDAYGGFQTLLRAQCPDERGVSIALGYDEMRVVFNRFEDNIESFEVERMHAEAESEFQLPD